MQMVGAAEAGAAEVEALQDLQHLERGDALAVGRQLPHVVAAVVDAERFDPLGAVRGEVFVAEEAADSRMNASIVRAIVAAVEGVAAAAAICSSVSARAALRKISPCWGGWPSTQERLGEAG